jgi:hypothetical protein
MFSIIEGLSQKNETAFFLKKKSKDLITSLHFFVLTQKNEAKKSQDCARLARKISVQTAKSSKLARSSLKQGRFLTLFSLIFRLIGRGRSHQ